MEVGIALREGREQCVTSTIKLVSAIQSTPDDSRTSLVHLKAVEDCKASPS